MGAIAISEPHSLDEAFSLLGSGDPDTRPVGGGTALMLMMKSQLYKPSRLVSLRSITNGFSACGIEIIDGHLRIGALTTFTELEVSDETYQHFPVVRQTMRTLANVRVRNVATVGGNLAHADPHLDLPPVWMSLNAVATLVSPRGRRKLQVADLIQGYYETALEPDELIEFIELPLEPGWRSLYTKVTTRSAHDWPAIGLAVSAKLTEELISDVSIVLSAAIDRPVRLIDAEAQIRGAPLTQQSLARAVACADTNIMLESDERGSRDYKRHLLGVYLGRTLQSLCGKEF